jgi:hypothetical protein
MKQGMTRAARAEITNAIRERYRSAAGKAKRRILDEFIAVTGYHEKSAIRVLNSVPSAMVRRRHRRRRCTMKPPALPSSCCGRRLIGCAASV